MPPFRVVIGDKQKLFLQAIRKNIEGIPDIEVIGEVYSVLNLLDIMKKSTVDLIIMDVENLQDIETLKEIKESYPEIKILILNMTKSKELLMQAILLKVDGYMITENAYSDLITAIHKISQGERYFCNIISGIMADIIHYELIRKVDRGLLSDREITVLTLRCKANSSAKIAELLSISPKTVACHITNIKKKLGIKTTSELMQYAIKHGHLV